MRILCRMSDDFKIFTKNIFKNAIYFVSLQPNYNKNQIYNEDFSN